MNHPPTGIRFFHTMRGEIFPGNVGVFKPSQESDPRGVPERGAAHPNQGGYIE
jgi:hypothetical protein